MFILSKEGMALIVELNNVSGWKEGDGLKYSDEYTIMGLTTKLTVEYNGKGILTFLEQKISGSLLGVDVNETTTFKLKGGMIPGYPLGILAVVCLGVVGILIKKKRIE